MHRRTPPATAGSFLAALVVMLVVLLVALVPTSTTAVAAPADAAARVGATAPVDTDDLAPSTIPDDFIPEDQNLSDCLGFVERPGCGSEARGGWRQTLVFVAIAGGLAVVFWRVAVGVRRNRRTGRDPRPDPESRSGVS